MPRTGLVAEYLFNKNASDTSGNGHVGTVHGATLVNDRFGRPMSAYHFDGVSQTIEIADAPDLALTGDLTISAWIKPDAIGVLDGIVSKYQASGDNSYTLRFGFTAPYSYYDFDNALRGAPVPPAQVMVGQWQHVAAVLSGSTVTLYVNGAPGMPLAVGYPIIVNTRPVFIGVDFNTRYFDGAIDDVRLYSRALQTFEIESLYTEPQ